MRAVGFSRRSIWLHLLKAQLERFQDGVGHRIGRRRVLAMTIITMAIGTFTTGLITSYASIGIWSAVLVLVAPVV